MVGYRWVGVNEETVPDGGFFFLLQVGCVRQRLDYLLSSSGAGTDSLWWLTL